MKSFIRVKSGDFNEPSIKIWGQDNTVFSGPLHCGDFGALRDDIDKGNQAAGGLKFLGPIRNSNQKGKRNHSQGIDIGGSCKLNGRIHLFRGHIDRRSYALGSFTRHRGFDDLGNTKIQDFDLR